MEFYIMETNKKRVFVAGCGYVGLALARLLRERGWKVLAGTYGQTSAAALQGEGFQAFSCDLADPQSVAAVCGLSECEAVVHCASSGRGGAEAYERVYFNGAQNLAAVAPDARLIFTSSTSVYAQIDGEWVTEKSAAAPDRDTGRWLRATEDFVVSRGGMVARLAGIYGPGRSVLLRKFLSGEAVLEGDGERWVNQVHREDIASGLAFLLEAGVGGVFNLADDRPLTQKELYSGLAERLGRPMPPYGPVDFGRKRGWTHKRVSNAKLKAMGWRPRYGSFFEALENDPELLAAASGGDAGGQPD
jgi:nucleoside-diphosphate-sugar epimerase